MRHVLARDTNTNTVVILCDFEPSDFLVPVDVMPAPAKVAEFYGARAEDLARVVFAAVGPQKDEPKANNGGLGSDGTSAAELATEPLAIVGDPQGGEVVITRDGVMDAEETVSDDQLDTIPTLAGWPPPAESTAPTGDAVAEAVESA